MASWQEPERSIREVVESGGWVRQQLRRHGVHPDPEQWRGMPGVEVAAGLIAAVRTIDMDPYSPEADRRDDIIYRCAPVVGEVAVPAVTAEIA